jgi:ABC-2 type transport system permease protein
VKFSPRGYRALTLATLKMYLRNPLGPSAVFLALLRRDLRVARRELPFFLLRTALQPLLFTIVFGYLLPRMGFMQGGYATTLLPGILAVSLTLSSVQSVALPLVQDFGWSNEIEDRLLAPVSTRLVAVEKVCAGALQGVVSALFVLPVARLIMGPVAGLTLGHGAMVLVVTVLGAVAFSALGLLLGTAISPQQIGLMFSVIVSPMIFFGCTYYPWQALGVLPVLKYLVLLNPLVYVAEGMRAVLTPGVPHMHLGAVTGALGALSASFLALGLRSFERRAVG